jgi:hypothetical protein
MVLTIVQSATQTAVHNWGWLTTFVHAFFTGLLAPYVYLFMRGPAPMVIVVSRAWGLLLVPAMRAVDATALHDALSALLKCVLGILSSFEKPLGRLLVAVFVAVPAYRLCTRSAREKGVRRAISCLHHFCMRECMCACLTVLACRANQGIS